MNSALLSRFDLIFILMDHANEDNDRLLSEHVMAQHTAMGGRASLQVRHAIVNSPSWPQSVTEPLTQSASHWSKHTEEHYALKDRLRLRRGESFDAIPVTLFTKYVQYARQYV